MIASDDEGEYSFKIKGGIYRSNNKLLKTKRMRRGDGTRGRRYASNDEVVAVLAGAPDLSEDSDSSDGEYTDLPNSQTIPEEVDCLAEVVAELRGNRSNSDSDDEPSTRAIIDLLDAFLAKEEDVMEKMKELWGKCEVYGYCLLNPTATTRTDDKDLPLHERQGYTQIRFNGDKGVRPHVFVAFLTSGRAPAEGEQASHLCGHSTCIAPGHVVFESAQANAMRKNCQVQQPCQSHTDCGKMHDSCTHEPRCIKFHPELTQEDYLSRSWCHHPVPMLW